MTAPLKTIEGTADLEAAMRDIGRRAKAAARVFALAPTTQKNQALAAMAQAIRADRAAILAANAEDMAEGRASGLTSASLDRLELNDKRIEGMAEAVERPECMSPCERAASFPRQFAQRGQHRRIAPLDQHPFPFGNLDFPIRDRP